MVSAQAERNKEEGNTLVVDNNDRTSVVLLQGEIELMHAIKIPGAPNNWSHPAAKTEQGEPSFENVDNPGEWSSFTLWAEYEKGRGTSNYKLHSLPIGASPVPLVYGKRKVADWDFYHNGWHRVREFQDGATPDNLFPEARKVSLDWDMLSKMGLMTALMIEGDALFFINCYYQFSILSVC